MFLIQLLHSVIMYSIEELCHKNEIKRIMAQTTLLSCYLQVSSALAGHYINL